MNTEEKFTVPSTQFVENPDGYVLKASLSFFYKWLTRVPSTTC